MNKNNLFKKIFFTNLIFNNNKISVLLSYFFRKKNFLKLNKKIIFIHIPRSKGTYIINIIKRYYGKFNEINSWRHLTLKNLEQNKIIGGHINFKNFEEYNKDCFTIIRKPQNLYQSYYNLFCKHKKNKTISYSDFVFNCINNNTDNILTRIFSNKLNKTKFFFFKKNIIKKKRRVLLTEKDLYLAYTNIKKINYFKFENESQILNFLKITNKFNKHLIYKGKKTKSKKLFSFDKLIKFDKKLYQMLFSSSLKK